MKLSDDTKGFCKLFSGLSPLCLLVLIGPP